MTDGSSTSKLTPFWTAQLLGWGAYGLAKYALARAQYPSAGRVLLLVGIGLVISLPLRLLFRRLRSSGVSQPATIAIAAVASFALANVWLLLLRRAAPLVRRAAVRGVGQLLQGRPQQDARAARVECALPRPQAPAGPPGRAGASAPGDRTGQGGAARDAAVSAPAPLPVQRPQFPPRAHRRGPGQGAGDGHRALGLPSLLAPPPRNHGCRPRRGDRLDPPVPGARAGAVRGAAPGGFPDRAGRGDEAGAELPAASAGGERGEVRDPDQPGAPQGQDLRANGRRPPAGRDRQHRAVVRGPAERQPATGPGIRSTTVPASGSSTFASAWSGSIPGGTASRSARRTAG